MGDIERTAEFPSAYALSLWLRGVVTTPGQIASALDVEPDVPEQRRKRR
jgi:hypothetical protein